MAGWWRGSRKEEEDEEAILCVNVKLKKKKTHKKSTLLLVFKEDRPNGEPRPSNLPTLHSPPRPIMALNAES